MYTLYNDKSFTIDEDTELWNWYRGRYLNTDFSKIDTGILPVVQYFGKQSGVIPLWSCQGHEYDDVSRAHLFMVVSPRGEKWYEYFWLGFTKYCLENGNFDFIELPKIKSHLSCGPSADTFYPIQGFDSQPGCRGENNGLRELKKYINKITNNHRSLRCMMKLLRF